MRSPSIENCKITSTSLGNFDHGIMTLFLHLEGDGWGCGFGGYALDEWKEEKRDRVDIPLFGWFIRRIFETLEVDTWENLKGMYIRASIEGPGGGVLAIGHLIKDKWFEPKKEIEEYLNESKIHHNP